MSRFSNVLGVMYEPKDRDSDTEIVSDGRALSESYSDLIKADMAEMKQEDAERYQKAKEMREAKARAKEVEASMQVVREIEAKANVSDESVKQAMKERLILQIKNAADNTFADRRYIVSLLEKLLDVEIGPLEVEETLTYFHEFVDEDRGEKWKAAEAKRPISIWGRYPLPFPSARQQKAMQKWGFRADGTVNLDVATAYEKELESLEE